MREQDMELHRVLAVAKQEPEVMSVGDIDAWLSILADDAVYMPPNSESREGENLRGWLGDFLRSSSIEWLEYVDGHTGVSGDLAFHDYFYEWRVTPKKGGDTIAGRGKGIQILWRQPDGSWKIVRNIWNSNPSR